MLVGLSGMAGRAPAPPAAVVAPAVVPPAVPAAAPSTAASDRTPRVRYVGEGDDADAADAGRPQRGDDEGLRDVWPDAVAKYGHGGLQRRVRGYFLLRHGLQI